MLWLAKLNAHLFWFNPLAWWVERRLAALAEQTSDDAAVESLGNRADYAEILLGLAAERSSALATAMAGSNLSSRIERILSGVALSTVLKRWQLALTVAAILPAVAAAAAAICCAGPAPGFSPPTRGPAAGPAPRKYRRPTSPVHTAAFQVG